MRRRRRRLLAPLQLAELAGPSISPLMRGHSCVERPPQHVRAPLTKISTLAMPSFFRRADSPCRSAGRRCPCRRTTSGLHVLAARSRSRRLAVVELHPLPGQVGVARVLRHPPARSRRCANFRGPPARQPAAPRTCPTSARRSPARKCRSATSHPDDMAILPVGEQRSSQLALAQALVRSSAVAATMLLPGRPVHPQIDRARPARVVQRAPGGRRRGRSPSRRRPSTAPSRTYSTCQAELAAVRLGQLARQLDHAVPGGRVWLSARAWASASPLASKRRLLAYTAGWAPGPRGGSAAPPGRCSRRSAGGGSPSE